MSLCYCFIQMLIMDWQFQTDVLSPFEKTNVTLTCGASVYAFSRIHWYYTDNHNVTTPIKRKSRGYSLESNLTSFSKVSVLTLIDVDVNRTGMYSCSATRPGWWENQVQQKFLYLFRSMYDWFFFVYMYVFWKQSKVTRQWLNHKNYR